MPAGIMSGNFKNLSSGMKINITGMSEKHRGAFINTLQQAIRASNGTVQSVVLRYEEKNK